EQQSDQQLLSDVASHLIDNTKFDLPAEFLQKWLANSGETPISAEEAKKQYDESEKGLRYQLIEGKVAIDNKLQNTYEELKDYAKEYVKMQMAQYGQQMNFDDAQMSGIVDNLLQNEEETKKLQDQLISTKFLAFYKENVNLKVKELTFEKFIDTTRK
ncbi:MAG: hypothetical protein KAG14_05010, partial [Mycoplasmataceae bacterium]|nr:hypothetical protein [Mycoplasmataceae bacterium]